MTATALRRDESLGLALALLGHAALLGWLVWQRAPAPLPPPDRMTVTISEEVGLTAAAPAQAAPAPDTGPVLGEVALPPLPQTMAKPVSLAPRPLPAPATQSAPPKPQQKPVKVGKRGAAAFDVAFDSGIPQAKPGGTAQTQASPITGAVRSSLVGAISRQLKPKWRGQVPTGLDAEKLITVLTWDLNPDGSLTGTPRVVRQEGITPGNRAQASRHAEVAVRAVVLAAPFTLPPQYYAGWRHISDFRFDRSLSQ